MPKFEIDDYVRCTTGGTWNLDGTAYIGEADTHGFVIHADTNQTRRDEYGYYIIGDGDDAGFENSINYKWQPWDDIDTDYLIETTDGQLFTSIQMETELVPHPAAHLQERLDL